MPRPAVSITSVLASAFGPRAFGLADAAQLGVTRGQLRAAVARGEVQTVRFGQYVVAVDPTFVESTHPDWSDRLTAALRAIPGSVVGYDSARRLRHLPDPYAEVDEVIHLIRTQARYREHVGVFVHGSPLPPNHITELDGFPVTTLARTAIDCCRTLPLRRGLIIMDAALRQEMAQRCGLAAHDPSLRHIVHDADLQAASMRPFIDVLRFLNGWPGVIAARRAVNAADPASESPLESISQGVFHEFGFPIPESGVPVVGDDGVTYWADKLWRDQRVIGECDGAVKYVDRSVLMREKARQEALERAGWIVVRWTWEEITQRPEVVLARIRRALLRAAA